MGAFMKWRILVLSAFLCLAACGDDDSDFATRPDGEDLSSSDSETRVSSSSVKSSSSEKAESSSSKAIEPAEGMLTDSRDGKTYKTVTIGTQTWMAENLNYDTNNSYCYDDNASNCIKYGRLYTWAAAMDSVGTWSTNSKGCGYGTACSPTYPVRGICPEGWHLPTQTEWNTLFTAVGGQSTAGKMLKSTSGWYSSGNGTDAYSFSALPAGRRYYNGYFNFEGNNAFFWSSTERGSDYAYNMDMNYSNDDAYLNNNYKNFGFSVRCVKDDGETAGSSSSKKDESGSSSSVKSSSSATSSSSEEAESSSSKTAKPTEGTLTDSRDGQTYKTVTIGTQTWMAENLNYQTANSYCYNDNASNCTKYGRLYTWAAAMDSAGTWSTNGKGCGYGKTCSPTYPVRGVCPEGWHLPTQTEWNTLFTAVGGSSTAGEVLKSTSGWNSSGNGSDTYSLSALPAGNRGNNGGFDYEGIYALFWSSTENNSNNAYNMYLYYYYGDADLSNRIKDYGFSVRCVKD